MAQMYRLHYRGQLNKEYTEAETEQAISRCMQNIKEAQKSGKVLTAALYHWGKMLFFYYEAVGEPIAVTEPILWEDETANEEALLQQGVPESGEDVQLDVIKPEVLLAPLQDFLQVWPGQEKDRLWVHMYYIYCHSKPKCAEDWKRAGIPERRRGRIAFLRDDKLFSYVYYHRAIVEEGLLLGDRYQSIALHENILFSYFEEPKTMVNIQEDYTRESQVIQEWLDVNPESHFIHRKEGLGENFMFLPAYFAMGVEDMM